MSRKKGFTRVGSLDESDPPSKSTGTSRSDDQQPTSSQDIMRNQSDTGPRQMLPAIYAVPTSDTFDDGSTVNRPILSHQTPTHSYSTHPTNGSIGASQSGATPVKSNAQGTIPQAPIHPPPPQSHIGRSPKTKSIAHGKSPTTERKRINRPSRAQNQPRDFQFAEDLPSVAVRAIDLDTRSAYEKYPCPTVSQWKEFAHRIKIPDGKKKSHLYRRMSPSLQHLELLQMMQRQSIVRQLQFAPSCGIEADPFVGQSAAFGADKARSKRDGRYRPVHVLQAYINSLPETAPSLSHRKTRLPTRADVGFPGATEEEIVSKQREISHETEWEEATPRLAVLVDSTDLGTTVEHPDWAKDRLSVQHLQWNGGGLEGMPYCGKNLIRSFEQNAIQWGRQSTELTKFLMPDPFSMFAPPLGATYSRSLGWRPRPFHDRRPGMEYAAVCPMKIDCPAGEIEPLFCCLALYSLPNVGSKAADHSYGKLSEEFWLPAGDWSGITDASPEATTAAQRTYRAIFSYDKLELSAIGLDSLYVVLKVFKQNGKTKTSAKEVHRPLERQILTPVCFGVSSLYADHEPGSFGLKWPAGEIDEMDLFPFPVQPEAEEAFVERLCHMTSDKETTSMVTKSERAPGRDETRTKKNRLANMFRSPMKGRSVPRLSQAPSHIQNRAMDSICGKATLFKSSLGFDFLESLLSEPQEIARKYDKNDSTGVPRLLSDPTGDNAVILRGKSAVGRTYKRSNLARMPNASEAAQYCQVADSREVLGMPIRREKSFLDPPLPTRSLVNLLYILPRFLILKHGEIAMNPKYPTVRIRLVRTEESIDLEKGGTKIVKTPISSIYSKCPWAGSGVVESAYTAIVGSLGAGNSAPNLKEGLSFLDEIKVRLPLLIDGTCSLEFSLFDVITSNEGGLSLSHIATANIPLSSSGTRDPGSGSKVATIIPNGVHRVKIGDCQLQVETRLFTPLHVPDPAVAVALRDFPFARNKGEERQGSVNDLGAFKSQSTDSIDQRENFPDLLSSASPASIVAHFPVLLYMHLSNLVNLREKVYDGLKPGTQFMMGTMLSLFEMIRLAKLSFRESNLGIETSQREHFVKLQVDLFDENKLSASQELSEADDDGSAQNDADSVSSQDIDDNGDEVAVSLQKRKTLRKSTEARVAKIAAELGAVGVPLSRSAYGASKTDRMRLQGEILGDGEIDHFFEDDETVATMSTYHPMAADREAHLPTHILDTSGYQESANSTPSIADITTGEKLNVESSQNNNEFANRMKSAAQSLLAPCVGQSLTNIILPPSRSGSPRSMELGNVADLGPSSSGKISTDAPNRKENILVPQISQSGSASDSDSDNEDAVNGMPSFRGPSNSPILRFSASRGAESDFLVACGSFLYESIFLLWLRAWLDFIEGGIESSVSVDSKITSFVVLPESGSKNDQPIFAFFANLDFLLPLCLKSIVMRYNVEVLPNYPASTKAIVDDGHLRVLEPFVEMLARGLMGQALAGLISGETLEESLLRALKASIVVNEFLAGLATVLHAEHIHSLLVKYFRTLRDCETEHLGDLSSTDFQWNSENLHRVRSSRQLRLQAIEAFSTMPTFIAFNYPRKYGGVSSPEKATRADWLHQYVDFDETDFWNPRVTAQSKRAPPSGWLAHLLTREALSICSLSSESVVAEAMAHIEATSAPQHGLPASSALKKRPGATLKREDLLMFQSLSIQAITCVYELLIRRHVMDRRFQKESSRGRIAGMLAGPIFEKALQSVRWLARMEATHRVRSTWCLVLVYILQEAPETLLTHMIRSYCDPKEFKIHKFLRLLRLCTSSFQSFIDRPIDSKLSHARDKGLSAWLLQESFNTVCAAANTVVEASVGLTSNHPQEERKMLQGLLDLLLHILTTPQSSVTHLRAVGSALQALEKFGVELFLEITGTNFQHWVRILLSLMNSVSLSVRSIAVDFFVSLVGSIFDTFGNVGDLSLVAMTVLPEVVAREIALYSVHDLIKDHHDVAKAVWPLRRSLVDLDGNPLDDDRIDPHLSPILSSLCRACQAVIDGVIIELRLKGNRFLFRSNEIPFESDAHVLDADEESLYEAANFFVPETGPLQRIRWFLTLKAVHEKKGQWVEAAEALMMCSRTILDSIRHLRYVWRPSKFLLWTDNRRAHWLDHVGEESKNPERGNAAVIDFADEFLEPVSFGTDPKKPLVAQKLHQPTAAAMCEYLCTLSKEAVKFYLKESGTEEQAFMRLESLQRTAMSVLESNSVSRTSLRSNAARRRFEEDAAVRTALISLGVEITGLTQRMDGEFTRRNPKPHATFCFVRLSGKKPLRLQESVSLPCFLELQETSICRIPQSILKNDKVSSMERICRRFAEPLLQLLRRECGTDNVVLITRPPLGSENQETDDRKTYLHVYTANCSEGYRPGLQCRRFYSDPSGQLGATVEMTVAQPFPCALSRQRSVLTTETAPMNLPV